jgi:hypothetical protein
MSVSLDEVVRTTINFTLADGTQFQNVWHHRKIGASSWSDANIVTAIQSWADSLYDGLQNRVEVGITPQLCSVDKVAFVVSEWEVTENLGTFAITFTGSDANQPLPNQCSAFITYKTIRPKTVGRKFLFPFTEAYQDHGIMTGTLVTSLTTFAAAGLADIYLGPLDDLEPGVPRTGVDAFYAFTAAVVTNLYGTQRRRRPGYGA